MATSAERIASLEAKVAQLEASHRRIVDGLSRVHAAVDTLASQQAERGRSNVYRSLVTISNSIQDLYRPGGERKLWTRLSLDCMPPEVVILIAEAVQSYPDGHFSTSSHALQRRCPVDSASLLKFSLVDRRTSEIVLPVLWRCVGFNNESAASVLAAMQSRAVSQPDSPHRVLAVHSLYSYVYPHERLGEVEKMYDDLGSNEDKISEWVLSLDKSEDDEDSEDSYSNPYGRCAMKEPEKEQAFALLYWSLTTLDVVRQTAGTLRTLQIDITVLLLWQSLDLTDWTSSPLRHLEHVTLIDAAHYSRDSSRSSEVIRQIYEDALNQLGPLPALRSLDAFSINSRSDMLPVAKPGPTGSRLNWDGITTLKCSILSAPAAKHWKRFFHLLPHLTHLDLSLFLGRGKVPTIQDLLADGHPFETTLQALTLTGAGPPAEYANLFQPLLGYTALASLTVSFRLLLVVRRKNEPEHEAEPLPVCLPPNLRALTLTGSVGASAITTDDVFAALCRLVSRSLPATLSTIWYTASSSAEMRTFWDHHDSGRITESPPALAELHSQCQRKNIDLRFSSA